MKSPNGVYKVNTISHTLMEFLNYLPVILNQTSQLKDSIQVGDQELKMVVRKNGQDAEYWTNIDCSVYQDYKWWKKGDRVFIKYVEMREAFGSYNVDNPKSGRSFYLDGQEVAMIKPDLVYLTIRDGQYIPSPGWSLVLPVKDDSKKSGLIILLDDSKPKFKKDFFDVVAVGDKSPIQELTFGTDAIPEVGMRVFVKKNFGIPLEAALNRQLDKNYFLVRHNEVMGYEV
jgi:hypothetical protein